MADLRIVDAPVLLQEGITDDVKIPQVRQFNRQLIYYFTKHIILKGGVFFIP